MPDQPQFEIPRALWKQMIDHARTEAPREAVGLLGSQSIGRAQYVYPLPNVAGPLAFFADPYAQYQAERSLRTQNAEPIGYYHSHPGGGIDLSDQDRSFALRRDWVYIVIALGWNGEGVERVAAYRWLADELCNIKIVIPDLL